MRTTGTHDLRKRCPCCKKVRKFYEPPGDQGGKRVARRSRWEPIVTALGFLYDKKRPKWILTPFGWACVHCAETHKSS
jgi:hypothetical protein